MKRYLLNKLNKINHKLLKQYVEPIKILCVYEENGLLISNLLSDCEITEKRTFKTEQNFEQYIKANEINNIIKGICFDKI